MCATFRLSAAESAEIKKILQEVEQKQNEQLSFDDTKSLSYDFYPKYNAPVAKADGSGLKYNLCKWGFPKYNSSSVIYNARAESAHEKALFSNSLFNRRLIVPVTGFYEWSHIGKKAKYLFTLPKTDYFYLGGIYKVINNEECFVIMTCAANESMHEIHNRMPLILPPDKALAFLNNRDFACSYYTQEQPPLKNSIIV